MLRYRSNTCSLFIGLLFCTLSCAAVADVPAEKAELKHVPGTTKGVIDIETLERPDDATRLVGVDKHIMVPESRRGTESTFDQGVLTMSERGGDHLITPKTYTDFVMHVEFNVNHNPDHPRGNDGNSGVYIQQRYEVQILNSHGVSRKDYRKTDAGSLYKFKTPDKLVSKPAGQWQAYDIVFRAARFEGDKKTKDARITVYHNGVLIHDDVVLPNKTGAGKPEGPNALPIRLQGHSNPVKFRNVWIKELDLR